MKKELYNLTIPQKSILLTEQYYSNTNINNVCGTALIKSEINFQLLEQALNLLVKNNHSLRIKLIHTGNTYMQTFNDYKYTHIDTIELNSLDELKNLQDTIVKKRFNLEESLCEIKMFKLPKNNGGFMVNAHHIIADGWTLGLISRKVMEAYEALLNNTNIEYNEKFSYLNYIQAEKDYLISNKFINDKEYWNKQFENIPTTISLPSTTKSSDEFSCIADRELFSISKTLLSNLQNFCKERKISLFNFFMAIFSIYLYKITNSTDFTIGTPILNRSNFNEKNMTGMFINTIPLRITIDKNETFDKLVSSIATNTLNALRHQKYPYEYLLEDLRKKDPSIPSLYNIVLSYQVTKANNTTNFEYTTDWNFNGSIADDLSIQFYDLDDSQELTIAYDYKKLKYSQDFIKNMHKRIIEIIKQILTNPTINILDIEIVTTLEKNKILNTFNNTNFNYNKKENIIEQFYKIVKKFPNKIAIICNNEKITYDELNKKSNILANYLKEKNKNSSSIIGIMLNRSIEMTIGLLAILKSGSAYLPIDPEYPEERITYMLENSESSILLVNDSTENIIKFKNKINISLNQSLYNEYDSENIHTNIQSEDLIYLIYTSGSTGKPKGVMLKHQNIINFLHGIKKVINFNSNKTMTSVTTICFDIFVLEFWGALTSGMTLLIANEIEQNNAEKLNILCSNNNADMIQTTPSRFSAYLQTTEHTNFIKNMSDIMIGGEAFPEALFTKLKNITKASIFNMYGPTETAVWSTIKEITKDISIGTPIVNTSCYILNKDKNLLPPYIPGELYIGGDGVSKGYYKRDELTNEKFITSPFKESETIYNTGDLAYYTHSGEIIHLGRTDFQIKLRGYRIELGEIENKILNIPEITHNIVIPDDSNKYLICYYTAIKELEQTAITDYLLKELPNYMIPSYFYKLDKLPLTPNGKLDRKKLPKINIEQKDIETYSTKTEKILSTLISEITNTEKIDINAPFMTIGLDSLDLIQIQTKLIKYNFILNTQDFFKFNTVKSLSKHIDNNIHIYKDTDAQVPLEFRHKPDEILAYINTYTLSDEFLGNVFLTGANGFIGIHLLKDLLTTTSSNIYCLVRGTTIAHATERLKEKYNFYFNESLDNYINTRVFVFNGNIEKHNLDLSNKNINLIKLNVSTIIHTAAIVKHYGNFEEFQKININGTKNIAELSYTLNKRLIHISSISVSGNYLVKQDNRNIEFSENNLYIGQNYSNNVYVHSKFEAEKVILEYMKKGLNAQIHRIGILSGRLSDGVFQENISDNAFYNRIKSIILLSAVSKNMLKHEIEFTPVDICTRAIIRLAKNKIADNKIYHLYNHNFTTIENIINCLQKFNINIDIIDDNEFQNKIINLSSKNNSKALSGIINDLSLNDNSQMSINYNFSVNIKSNYTQKYLHLLKCDWNPCDKNYLNRIISYMRKVNFI